MVSAVPSSWSELFSFEKLQHGGMTNAWHHAIVEGEIAKDLSSHA